MAVVFKAIKTVVRPLIGKGFARHQPIRFLYPHFIRLLDFVSPRSVTIEGNTMFVDPREATHRKFLFFDRWEVEKFQSEIFKKIVKRDMNVIDIGANIGFYSLLSAKLIGDKGNVFCFEPIEKNIRLLKKNIKESQYKNIKTIQKAVSNENGIVKMSLCYDGAMSSIITSESDHYENTTSVQVTTIDDYFKNNFNEPPKIDVIKMDIEGQEGYAMEGMKKTLQRNKNIKIFTEFFPKMLRASGYIPERFLGTMHDMGFRIFLIDEKNEELTEISKDMFADLEISVPIATNLLCVRE